MNINDQKMAFHILSKPKGALCNMRCDYCFFLSKDSLYPGSNFRMSNEVLEEYLKQYIGAHQIPQVTVAWQGGEPTLRGLDFFKKTVELSNKYRKPGMTINYTMQTNGTRLNDEWCQFFRENDYLIGLSLDGPKELHDTYRKSVSGDSRFNNVMRAISLLKKHDVEFNILTTVNKANEDYPLDVYKFLRDEIGAQFIQFIPVVERANKTGYQEGNTVTERSVNSRKYGDFLIKIFDEWVFRDVGNIFIQIFDSTLASWMGETTGLCVFSPTCGTALALEHNGDLYSCDHYVEPDFFIGNIMMDDMADLVSSKKQKRFGIDKLESLPMACKKCDVLFACHGGCPKNRFLELPPDKNGLNYLCAGYKEYFYHVSGVMRFMSKELKEGRAPANIMNYLSGQESGVK